MRVRRTLTPGKVPIGQVRRTHYANQAIFRAVEKDGITPISPLLWITREKLWITASRCGQNAHRNGRRPKVTREATARYGGESEESSKIWKRGIILGIHPALSESAPQMRVHGNFASRQAIWVLAAGSVHVWVRMGDVHTFHRPY